MIPVGWVLALDAFWRQHRRNRRRCQKSRMAIKAARHFAHR